MTNIAESLNETSVSRIAELEADLALARKQIDVLIDWGCIKRTHCPPPIIAICEIDTYGDCKQCWYAESLKKAKDG